MDEENYAVAKISELGENHHCVVSMSYPLELMYKHVALVASDLTFMKSTLLSRRASLRNTNRKFSSSGRIMLASYNNADGEQHLSTDDGNSIHGDNDRSKDLFWSARRDQIRICLVFFYGMIFNRDVKCMACLLHLLSV